MFLVEVINVLMRKVLGLLRLKNECLILAGCLIAGMAAIYLAIGGHVWGIYKLPGRLLLMLPGFQMGRFYKEKLEVHDTLPDGMYFLIVIGVQIVISIFCAGLSFSAVWVTGFANGPIVPYLTVVTGIAFWLRVARVIGGIPSFAEKMVRIGRNTFSVMVHHVAVFMLVKGFFYWCSRMTSFCAAFDREMFFRDINYIYMAGGAEESKWIYLLAGIGVPVLVGKGIAKGKGLRGSLWKE